MLLAALALLERPAGPVLDDFPESVSDGIDHPLACPVPPSQAQGLPPAVEEAMALRPAYERHRAAAGQTLVGRVIAPEGIPGAVAAFVRITEGQPWEDAGLPGAPDLTALDIRSYFEEAALALVDHLPAARAAESWFFRHTEAGRVLRSAQQAMRASGAPRPAWHHLVPLTQRSDP